MVTHSITRRPLVLCLYLVALLWGSLSQAATLTASVSRNQVAKDEVFQLKVVLDDSADGDELDLSGLNTDFYVGGPRFGSYTNNINGKVSRQSEWSITLAASRLGVLTIPAFEVQGAKSQPIKIQVAADPGAPAQDDLLDYSVKLDAGELYVGERTRLTTRLILKFDPRRFQESQVTPPQGDGLTITPLGQGKQYQTVIDGIESTVVEQQFDVLAEKSGDLTLRPTALTGRVINRNRYGSTRLVELDKLPAPVAIRVKDKPAGYQGVWLPTPGLTLNQLWQDGDGARITTDTVELEVGDVLTRTLVLSARNLSQQQLPELSLNYPPEFRLYPEPAQFSANDQGDTVMTVKQVLIANKAGEYQLPGVSINWWNTKADKPGSSQVSGLGVSVSPAAASAEPVALPATAKSGGQVQIVADAGWWPWLSLALAAGWLVTLILWWKSGHRPAVKSAPEKAPASGSHKALFEAIDSQDGIAFTRHLGIWKEQHPLSGEDALQLQTEVDAFMASLFAGESGSKSFDAARLKALLKQAKAPGAKTGALEKL